MIALMILFFTFSLCWGLIKFCFNLTWGLIKILGFFFLIAACPVFLVFLIIFGLSSTLLIPILLLGIGIPMFRHGCAVL